jgi:hypothetical protein
MSSKITQNFLPTSEPASTSVPADRESCRIPALTFVGTTLFPTATLVRLRTLTDRELGVCVMHLAEGRSQAEVAAWLGLSPRTVQRAIKSAVIKVPELEPLQVRQRDRHDKPVVVHLSQLSKRDRDSDLFDADEL